MKTYFKPLPLLLLLGAAFAYLFYDGEIGINILVADGVLLVSVMGIRPQLWSWGSFRCGVVGMLISAVSLIVVNSPTGFFAHLVSFILVVGFAQSRQLRFVWYALLWGGSSLLLAGRRAWRLHESAVNESTARTPVGNWLKTAVVPLALTAPFFALYAIGSSNFLVGIEHLVEPLQVWLGNTSLPYTVMLWCLGLLLVLPFFYTGDELSLSTRDEELDYRLQRKRKKSRQPFKATSLAAEYRRGVITLILLNALIFVVNLTDLSYLWIAPAELSAATLSEYVHAGTDSLTLSILLAMGYVLYFFRANLNFYVQSPRLRKLTYWWLAQNAFLALSVGLRNWYYVSAYGLAYGRIYVAILLLLILFGLFTLFRKVKFRLSFAYLLQVNGLAVWLCLIGYGAVNWPGVITRVNLRQPADRVDWSYLIYDLDERNTHLLRSGIHRLPKPLAQSLEHKRQAAARKAATLDWRSWNYATWRNRQPHPTLTPL